MNRRTFWAFLESTDLSYEFLNPSRTFCLGRYIFCKKLDLNESLSQRWLFKKLLSQEFTKKVLNNLCVIFFFEINFFSFKHIIILPSDTSSNFKKSFKASVSWSNNSHNINLHELLPQGLREKQIKGPHHRQKRRHANSATHGGILPFDQARFECINHVIASVPMPMLQKTKILIEIFGEKEPNTG